MNNSDYEIVMRYNSELQGLANYYSLAVDVSKRRKPVKYVYEQSLVKTLANKHKKTCTWVYRQYKTKFETGVTGSGQVPREEPKKPLIALLRQTHSPRQNRHFNRPKAQTLLYKS